MQQQKLEEKIYECTSKSHLGDKRILDYLKYQINGQPSEYYFCKPCLSLYFINDNGKIIYVEEDHLETIPFLLDEKGHLFDPADLLSDEVC